MLKSIGLLAALALATLTTQAQTSDAARFGIERDSLTARAANVREQVDAQIGSFKTSFLSIHGVRQKTTSYASGTTVNFRGDKTPGVRLKQQITKHKKSGVLLEKVIYYSPTHRLLLKEYYLNGQLSRLILNDGYRLFNIERPTPSQTVEFVQGDYIRKSYRDGKQPQYFFLARPRS
ncbi:hypothetical protein SAMN02745146_0909 [Hymenobacter daecheongensis DSM 21074]|uniref:Uncharacterized protein n=1 Tax=Hymenobacter daecheongensis DSM 21074 TaxID=1121955 RepID=A0A1M6B880_9BACT|nr:hypothetical protein [Hymenobacter daecheongensis]SHI44900.1 hypothetical protein SAMN02745146_0909 [Hymenobacter daecheongensis DSM 21074]